MTDLTIDGETFAVAVTGDANRPTLILAHALGTNHRMWDGQLEPLEKHFRIVRYDARGHGRSALGPTPVSLERLGRDALAIMDALDIDRAHWLGLSMGGMVGLWLLAHAPDRIERAVIANSAPRIGTPDSWNARILSVHEHGMAGVAPATLERWFGAAFAEREPQQIAAFKDMLLATDPAAYAAVGAALRDADLHEAIRGIQNDVLVIAGRDDPTVPPADAEALAAALPAGRLVELDARHVSNVEARSNFNAAVLTFLTTKRMPRAKPRLAAGVKKSSRTKLSVAERGSARRRSYAARNPLKDATKPATPAKAAGKKTPAKSPSRKPTGARTAAVAQRDPPRKAAPARPAATKSKAKIGAASAAAKTVATKTATTAKNKTIKNTTGKAAGTKTAATKTPARKANVQRSAATSAPVRRKTSVAKARSAVKTAARKIERPKGKATAKKIRPTKGRSKTIAPTKPIAAPRRKIVKKPRRPTSRRKP